MTPHSILEAIRIWYQTDFGQKVLAAEQAKMAELLENKFGYYLLEFSAMPDGFFSQFSPMSHKFTATDSALDLGHPKTNFAVIDFENLPFTPESLDAVILTHVLEFYEKPETLLAEIWTALIPNGYLILLSFNPFSLWGLYKALNHSSIIPFNGHYYSYHHLSQLLAWNNFSVDDCINTSYNVPFMQAFSGQCDHFYFALSQFAWPHCANVNIILARKQVCAVRQVKFRWDARLWEQAYPLKKVGTS
jgi:SAM-dependent methyltransferase